MLCLFKCKQQNVLPHCCYYCNSKSDSCILSFSRFLFFAFLLLYITVCRRHTVAMTHRTAFPVSHFTVIITIKPETLYGVSLQQYADDTQLYTTCSVNDAASVLSTLEFCLASLHSWFCHSGLALNSSKSEAIIFGTRQRLNSFPRPFRINSC